MPPLQKATPTKWQKAKDYLASCFPHISSAVVGATTGVTTTLLANATFAYTAAYFGYTSDMDKESARILVTVFPPLMSLPISTKLLDSITASLYPLSKEQNITPPILDDPPQNTTLTKIKKAKDYITSCLPHAFNVTLGATSALSTFFFTHAALNHTNNALGYNPDTIQRSAAIVAGTISLLINITCVNQLETAPKVIKHLLSFPKEMLNIALMKNG